ncbi:MAG: phosphoribosylanthranilate isomerase [Lachnospiraceae bacterium]|nr:phosphoribosylanthranilate isomerase [Lachnospiraceae bacterium]
MTKIKICGLTRKEDIPGVNVLLPDYIGFVFAEKSKRFISRDVAESLKKELDNRINAVGVFVDADPDEIVTIVQRGIVDAVQLHGNETDEYVSSLKTRVTVPVIQAFQIGDESDITLVCESRADMILLDNGKGTGQSFDWSMVNAVDRPFFLAGGLDDSNVGNAIRQLHPYAVDVSSRVERDGVKDFDKMKAFVTAVRKSEIEDQTWKGKRK